MSKLADLLKNPQRKTTPAAGSGISIGTSSAPPMQSEQPDALPAAGLNDLVAAKTKVLMGFGKLGKPAAPAPAPTPPSAAVNLANIDITLTTDVASWPNDTDGIDMSEPANQMKSLLAELANVLVTDDVSSAMQRVMVFLHENPNLSDTLLPEDIQLLVKSLQSSNGVIIAKKTATKGKKSQKSEQINDLAGDLADLGFNL